MVTNLVQDLRVGLRVLLREKGFCALAVVVLALGICGVTTMFSVVNGIMLRGFSFPNAARMVSVSFIDPTSKGFFGQNGQVSPMDFEDVRPKQQSFELMAAYISGATVNVTNEGVPRRYTGAYITDSFLRSEEHTSELQSRLHLVCRLLLEKKKKKQNRYRAA